LHMRHTTTLLLLLTLIMGCASHNRKITLDKGKVITFKIPYSGALRFSTRFQLANGQDAIAFFNYETYKSMDVFTMEGKAIKSIPLKELKTLERHIDDICALNCDSFIALGQYNNNIHLFNSEGKILRDAHVNDSFPHDTRCRSELWSSIYDGFIQNDSTLVFRSMAYDMVDKDKTLTQYQYTCDYDSITRLRPYFAAVKFPFSAHPAFHYTLPSFYDRILTKDMTSGELPLYTITPKNLLLFSWHSDSVFVINKNTYEIDKAFKVQSSYTKIGTPISLKDDYRINDFLQTNGSIERAFYDPYRDLYYVTVRHSIPFNTPPDQRRHDRKWSFLVYDKNFKQLNEINMETQYCYGEILITREGVLIGIDDYEKPNTPTQFQLFYVHQK
jgi:hypothetical protein